MLVRHLIDRATFFQVVPYFKFRNRLFEEKLINIFNGDLDYQNFFINRYYPRAFGKAIFFK